MKFYTNNHSFRQMEYPEIRELETGDKISICINNNPPKEMEFVDAIVVRPMFRNNGTWVIETTNGFSDINTIYEIKER